MRRSRALLNKPTGGNVVIMDIDRELLSRLRRAHRQAMSISTGLMGQLLEAQLHLGRCAGQLAGARLRLAAFPGGLPEGDMTVDDWRAARQDLQQQRFVDEDRLKATVGAVQFEAHIAAMTRPSRADFVTAVLDAQTTVEHAEVEVSDVMAAQALAGSRAGQLSKSLQDAADWLLAHDEHQLAAAVRP
jgi:hypothetical protein